MTTRNHQSIEQLGGTYSFTATVMGWKHIFIKQNYLDCIINSFHFHYEKKAIHTVGYCIMPSHLHWIIKLDERRSDISSIIGAFKSYTAHEILSGLKVENQCVHYPLHSIFSLNPHLKIDSPASLLTYFKQLAHNDSDQEHRFWQRNSDIKLIETYSFLRQKLNYIHYNPIQNKWNITQDPSEYPFSSFRYYQTGEDWYQLKIMNLF